MLKSFDSTEIRVAFDQLNQKMANAVPLALTSEWRLITCFIMTASGTVAYFALPFEPSPIIGIILSFACLSFFWLNRQGNQVFLFGGLLLFSIGFTLTSFETSRYSASPLTQTEKYFKLTAVVERIERRANAEPRLYVRGLNKGPLQGHKVRLSIKTKMPADLYVGAKVSLAAVMSAPKGPVFPDSFDFARKAFFEGITGVGFAVTPVTSLTANSHTGGLYQTIERTRQSTADFLVEKLGKRQGGLAAALLVGRRDYVPRDIVDDMRAVGLSHMLAISGMHMGIVTGLIFFLFEALFACIPYVALRIPPRKLAVPFALMGACSYLLLSGMSVSTQRAFVMVVVAMIAVLLNRKAFSLRSLAIAAILIFLWAPHSILTAGFQMSFSATAGLILYFNWYINERDYKKSKNEGRVQTTVSRLADKGANLFLMIFMTTLVAQLAVAPFSLYHFHALSMIALVANLIAMPLLSFAIMPLGMLTILLAIVGVQDSVFFDLFSVALTMMTDVGKSLADADFAQIRMPAFTSKAFGAGVAGLLILILLRPKWLGFSIYLVCLSLMLSMQGAVMPDVYIMKSGKSFVMIERGAQDNGDDKLSFRGVRRGSFTYDQAYNRLGLKPTGQYHKIPGECGLGGCLYHVKRKTILITNSMDVIKSECGQVDIIIGEQSIKVCGQGLLVTHKELERKGAHALYFDGQSVQVETVLGQQGKRPWTQ